MFAPLAAKVPVEALGADVDGMILDFILHTNEGYLDELEIIRGDSRKIIKLSLPDQIDNRTGR